MEIPPTGILPRWQEVPKANPDSATDNLILEKEDVIVASAQDGSQLY